MLLSWEQVLRPPREDWWTAISYRIIPFLCADFIKWLCCMTSVTMLTPYQQGVNKYRFSSSAFLDAPLMRTSFYPRISLTVQRQESANIGKGEARCPQKRKEARVFDRRKERVLAPGFYYAKIEATWKAFLFERRLTKRVARLIRSRTSFNLYGPITPRLDSLDP